MPRIHVDIGPPGTDLAGHWDRLIQRAAANVFMSPAALNAVEATRFAKIHVLLAWDKSVDPQQLVGVWAFGEHRIAPVWPAFLSAPPYDYAFTSGPVVDPAFMDDVIAAFFDAIERDPALPNVIRFKYLDGETEAYQAIARTLSARAAQTLTLLERARPFLAGESGLKRSGSTRKKLRQDWNRLSAHGAVDIVNERTPAATRTAFEAFLALEAASWKGARGTALLNHATDAAFTRRFIGDLADQGPAGHGNASVALLRIDGRPIAAQVLLYCGTMAYTWKTAFDAEYARYSPGVLLVDKMSDELVSTHAVEAIESCSPEGSFLSQLWTGQRMTVDLLVDVGATKSLGFTMEVMAERGYAQLKDLRNRLRAVNWPRLPKRTGLAASR